MVGLRRVGRRTLRVCWLGLGVRLGVRKGVRLRVGGQGGMGRRGTGEGKGEGEERVPSWDRGSRLDRWPWSRPF